MNIKDSKYVNVQIIFKNLHFRLQQMSNKSLNNFCTIIIIIIVVVIIIIIIITIIIVVVIVFILNYKEMQFCKLEKIIYNWDKKFVFKQVRTKTDKNIMNWEMHFIKKKRKKR